MTGSQCQSGTRDLAVGGLDDHGGFPDCLVPDSRVRVGEGSFGGVEPGGDRRPPLDSDGGALALAVTEAAAAAGRRVLVLTPGRDPGRLRPGVPAALPPSGDPDAGTAGLAVVGYCGRQPGRPGGELDPGPVFAACERVLRPGGVLAVITGPADTADTAGSVVAAARAAGLVYAQHIVLVRADIDGDCLAPAAHRTGPASPGGSPVHDDLLVFTKLGGQARS